MDFVCMCGCVFFLSLRLVVSFHEVIFHPVQTTVILSCDAIFFGLFFISLPEIPPRPLCPAEREADQ